MSRSLYENHWGSPTLTLLNVLGVLNVLNVLNVLDVLYVLNLLHVLHVLNMLMDASLACWALFSICREPPYGISFITSHSFNLSFFH